jgi:hypothetical protein
VEATPTANGMPITTANANPKALSKKIGQLSRNRIFQWKMDVGECG